LKVAIVQRGRGRKAHVHRITEAPKALSEDISARQRKYAISMGVRAVAFVIAAIAPIPIPFRILLIIAALVIPYVAVVYANGGREPTARADSPYEPQAPRAIAPTVTVLGSARPGPEDPSAQGPNAQGPNAQDPNARDAWREPHEREPHETPNDPHEPWSSSADAAYTSPDAQGGAPTAEESPGQQPEARASEAAPAGVGKRATSTEREHTRG
jgi:hypothetical protein